MKVIALQMVAFVAEKSTNDSTDRLLNEDGLNVPNESLLLKEDDLSVVDQDRVLAQVKFCDKPFQGRNTIFAKGDPAKLLCSENYTYTQVHDEFAVIDDDTLIKCSNKNKKWFFYDFAVDGNVVVDHDNLCKLKSTAQFCDEPFKGRHAFFNKGDEALWMCSEDYTYTQVHDEFAVIDDDTLIECSNEDKEWFFYDFAVDGKVVVDRDNLCKLKQCTFGNVKTAKMYKNGQVHKMKIVCKQGYVFPGTRKSKLYFDHKGDYLVNNGNGQEYKCGRDSCVQM